MSFTPKSAGHEVKEQKKYLEYSWLGRFVFLVNSGHYLAAKKVLSQNRNDWQEDLRKQAPICSAIYPRMQVLLYESKYREARAFARAFSDLGIENWLVGTRAIDKTYKAERRS
jgi:hypothetical protein